MARSYKRDSKGRFAKGAGNLKRRYQKGEKGAGAIHRRRAKQWKSGRKRDMAKVVAKSGSYGGAAVHAVSFARHKRAQKRKKRR